MNKSNVDLKNIIQELSNLVIKYSSNTTIEQNNLNIKPDKANKTFLKWFDILCPKGQEWKKNGLIAAWKSGSFLYGTNTPTSDCDYVAVTIPPPDFTLGLLNYESDEWSTKKNKTDKCTADDVEIKVYSLKKFVSMGMKVNPNICELLFAPENCIMFRNEVGSRLIAQAERFVTYEVTRAFTGYAIAQLHRLKAKSGNITGRTELIEKYGYDSKYLAHTFRLLYEGIEIMKTGRLELPLKFRKRLIEIRNGFYPTVEEGIEEAEKIFKDFNAAQATTNLKKKADFNFFHNFLLTEHFNWYKIHEY